MLTNYLHVLLTLSLYPFSLCTLPSYKWPWRLCLLMMGYVFNLSLLDGGRHSFAWTKWPPWFLLISGLPAAKINNTCKKGEHTFWFESQLWSWFLSLFEDKFCLTSPSGGPHCSCHVHTVLYFYSDPLVEASGLSIETPGQISSSAVTITGYKGLNIKYLMCCFSVFYLNISEKFCDGDMSVLWCYSRMLVSRYWDDAIEP